MVQSYSAATLIPVETEADVEITEDNDVLLEAELLVEDVSIDGMCGVY